MIKDIPTKCNECRLLHDFEDGCYACDAPFFFRHLTQEETGYISRRRADWCPLEPIQENFDVQNNN